MDCGQACRQTFIFWTHERPDNSVRSDHPFTKRSGDMVYTSVLD
jgi:hypothetical protein